MEFKVAKEGGAKWKSLTDEVSFNWFCYVEFSIQEVFKLCECVLMFWWCEMGSGEEAIY